MIVIQNYLPRFAVWTEQMEDFAVGEKCEGLLIELCHFRTKHHRRTKDGPERHHGFLLFRGKAGAALFAKAFSQFSKRKHIAVRPASFGYMILPEFASVEHVFEQIPVIPEVICDPPHISIGLIVPCFVDQSRSRRKGKDDRVFTALDGFCEHFDLMTPRIWVGGVEIGVADVVALDKIYAPGSIQFQERIVISLSFGGVAHAVHIRIPSADGAWIRHIRCVCVGSEHRGMQVSSNPRDAAHDMDSEFQPQAVNVFRQRSKSPAVR